MPEPPKPSQEPPTAPDFDFQPAKRFVRNLYTDEVEEIPYEGIGRQLIATTRAEASYRNRRVDPWHGGMISTADGITPEEASPERIAKENADARYHGTGAVYLPDGKVHYPTRAARAREHRRTGRQDNSAGFSDWAGR